MRIAAIDIGTNSIHMVIAEAKGPSGFDVVDREREVVQVGRGSFTGSRLRVDAIKRTAAALARYVQLARRHQVDRILCTATAAVREARNGHDFLAAARQASGVQPRVIPAAEEGRLIYLGVKSALTLDREPSLIVDIGGGSMQLAVGNREQCLRVVSAPLGALRLTETEMRSDPPSRRDLQRVRRLIRKVSRKAIESVMELGPRRVYGSSGSIHALAQVAHWLETGAAIEHINGHVLSRDALAEISKRLQRMTTRERERVPGLDSRRAEIIVPGVLVLLHVLDEAEADAITLSDYGVREGLVTDYIQTHGREITAFAEVDDLRLRSVLQCLAKFDGNEAHAKHVARLALELFDGLESAHGRGEPERELLHFAALLHDVGSAISYDGHGEHSYYIIKNANLRGLTAEELELIANVACYHGKPWPRKRDEKFAALGKDERQTVRWLAAMLRIAEGMDRSHYQLAQGLKVTRRQSGTWIRVQSRRDAHLEIWGAGQRTDLLAELLGTPVRVTLAGGGESGRNGAPANGRGVARRSSGSARNGSGPAASRGSARARRKRAAATRGAPGPRRSRPRRGSRRASRS